MRSRAQIADWTNTSLRNRLTIGVLVLSAIGFVGAGFGSQALLRNYLIRLLKTCDVNLFRFTSQVNVKYNEL